MPKEMQDKKTESDLSRDLLNIWHPCTQQKDFETTKPLMVERAEGIYLFDRQGKRYLFIGLRIKLYSTAIPSAVFNTKGTVVN